MKYLQASSSSFLVTDRPRFETLARDLGVPVIENPVNGFYSIDVSGEQAARFEGIETLAPFLKQMTELVAFDFRLTVCQLNTEEERPFDVVFYRIWAGKAWIIWLDALEQGFCRQAIDSGLWTDMADLGLF